jgi:hypothetical protein
VKTWVKGVLIAVVLVIAAALFTHWWVQGLSNPAADALERATRACYLADDNGGGTFADNTPGFEGESADEALNFFITTYGQSAVLAQRAQEDDPIWNALAEATKAITTDAQSSLTVITDYDGLINAPKDEQQSYIDASERINANVVFVTETCNSLRIYLNEQSTE